MVKVWNFITIESKVFRHEERETQSFYADFSICTPPTTRCTTGLISASPESQPSSSDAKTQLTDFSQVPQNPPGRHLHPPVTFPIWDFYFDISESHILSACAWTPALMLHLTNPCAKRKVLSLTKPKGKIYKTKSLGHYITRGVMSKALNCSFKENMFENSTHYNI